MKKLILFSCFFLITLNSCSTNKVLQQYIKVDIELNKTKSFATKLYDKKLLASKTLDIYLGTKIHEMNTRAKSFKQDDYDYLVNRYTDASMVANWNMRESKQLGFMDLVETNLPSTTSPNNKDIYIYQLSDPLFTKDKKQVLFSIAISKTPGLFLDVYVVIMKKEKGKWVLVEKVYDGGVY
ncbi:hypothetical protein [Flavobacterium sp.]|uniref:hypothetical protein n=1 Tax=Flavobacterium sp. TaxID=239 RepID=UPI00260A62EC|nr:hypothetical protein [Flavobacterium sp.]